MSETSGTPLNDDSTGGQGVAVGPRPRIETVHEAYSFACLSCGYGWEQAYVIEHHVARDGHSVIEYFANGVRVPSPLTRSVCPGCGGHKVRVLREGRVVGAESPWGAAPGFARYAEPAEPAAPSKPSEAEERRHRFRLFFTRRAA